MAVTRSWAGQVVLTAEAVKPPVPVERRRELWWLIGSSILIATGLLLVLSAKTRNFSAASARLADGSILNLNGVSAEEQLLPYLQFVPESDRAETAHQVFSFLQRHRPLPNVGALARIRVAGGGRTRAALPMNLAKPLFVVRTPAGYLRTTALSLLAWLAAFYAVHFAWRVRRFRGDPAILPALMLLAGLGLMLAVSIRDPLRDTLEASKFAWGVVAGCALLLTPLLRPFDYRRFSSWTYTPLLASFALFALLLRFGSGPTGSDSKVNLGPFQPVEIIKLLLVGFMAAYFANRWEWLRDLRERRLLPKPLRWLDLPRFQHALPVLVATGCALLLFFALKDMGPALVIGFLFLAMFGVARGRAGLAILGVAILVAGVTVGYRMGKPKTVVERIDMWTSPWDNNVRGGDQIAHSFWALSTGGGFGSGPGWGDPGMIPAGHTDLVLPALGEELGFCGVAAIALLFALLVQRALSAAMSAPDDYGFFLALGLGALVALEILFVSGGVLGAIPLSGVVSPFLSAGNSAMLANFLLFAIVLGISNHRRADAPTGAFRVPMRVLATALGLVAFMLVGKAASIQLLHSTDLLARDAYVVQQDGVKRPQHNPRINSLARELTRGDILDRNGVVLATSRWENLPDKGACCSRLESRYYPLGRATAHLIGNLRTGDNFHASNSSLIEHDQNAKLQGFANIAELAPLIRYRHQPGNTAIEELRRRDRTVRSSIDARLQQRAVEILERRLASGHLQRGALVIMSAASGDILALASTPLPSLGGDASDDELLDRARYGQYPPGSTFKLVTAMAALRKDPDLTKRRYHCAPLGGGRVGAIIPGWRRPIRDDFRDAAHGSPDMFQALTVSCNAYFAQLGVNAVGAEALLETAKLLEIPAGDLTALKQTLPFASYGQGEVVITPFKMARVAATIANDGAMPQGRWVLDDSNDRTLEPKRILDPERARFIASAMRSVVLAGTARHAMANLNVAVAGKTGTAQLNEGQPHAWFAGFAPYEAPPDQRIAFAVIVEHGGYGGAAAAPIARELIEAARDLGILAPQPKGK